MAQGSLPPGYGWICQLRGMGVHMQTCVSTHASQIIPQKTEEPTTKCRCHVPALLIHKMLALQCYIRCIKGNVREFPVKAEQDSLQAPYITDIPDPIHECELGAQDHVLELALRDSHCGLCVETNVGSKDSYGEVSSRSKTVSFCECSPISCILTVRIVKNIFTGQR